MMDQTSAGLDSPEKQTIVYRFATVFHEAFDQYADFCNDLLSTGVMTTLHSSSAVSSFFNQLLDHIASILSVPIAIGSFLLQIVVFVFRILMIPISVCQYLGINFPILTSILLLFTLISFYFLRRLTRQSLVSYVLYTLIPYLGSLIFTVFSLIFPQIGWFTRLAEFLLHPIRWLLGLVETVDRRAAPIRRTVEIFSPPPVSARKRQQSIQEEANSSRVQCCVCIHREKSVLLRPCNHLCLCDTCLAAVLHQTPPRCPICRTDIESHISVFL